MKDRFRLMGNFLATDDVPGSLFGFRIVADEKDYTDADRAFFKKHPEAGGYYDLGEGTPEDGSAEGAPVQDDMPRWDAPDGAYEYWVSPRVEGGPADEKVLAGQAVRGSGFHVVLDDTGKLDGRGRPISQIRDLKARPLTQREKAELGSEAGARTQFRLHWANEDRRLDSMAPSGGLAGPVREFLVLRRMRGGDHGFSEKQTPELYRAVVSNGADVRKVLPVLFEDRTPVFSSDGGGKLDRSRWDSRVYRDAAHAFRDLVRSEPDALVSYPYTTDMDEYESRAGDARKVVQAEDEKDLQYARSRKAARERQEERERAKAKYGEGGYVEVPENTRSLSEFVRANFGMPWDRYRKLVPWLDERKVRAGDVLPKPEAVKTNEKPGAPRHGGRGAK